MLLIVMSLGLVILLMLEARKPERWQWLWGAGSGATSAEGTGDVIDTRLERTQAARAVEGFVVVRPPEREPAGRVDTQLALLPGVERELFQAVEDDTALRPEEHDAFYHLLGVLGASDDDALAAASLGQATFAQLFQQPDAYRGEVIAVDGTVRGVYELTAGTNPYGVQRYYQLWLQPPDRRLPIVVQCLDLPDGFPTGTSLDEPVHVVGIFYKRWAYLAQDALRTAPMILARTVQWEPAATSERSLRTSTGEPIGAMTLAVIAAVALAAAAVVVRVVLGRERSFKLPNVEIANPSAKDWQQIDDQLPEAQASSIPDADERADPSSHRESTGEDSADAGHAS